MNGIQGSQVGVGNFVEDTVDRTSSLHGVRYVNSSGEELKKEKPWNIGFMVKW